MKFIFVDAFDLVWNGKTSRYKTGVSGSHNAPMYLAEALAKEHEVEFVSVSNHMVEDTYLNVKYTNMVNFSPTECDYIVMCNVLTTLSILDKIISFQKLIILTQNDLFHYNRLFQVDRKKVVIAYISEFAKRNILNVQPFLQQCESMLLYNSIDLADIPPIEFPKENALCFFSCVDRGYKIAYEVFKKLDGYTFYSNTYAENNMDTVCENSSKYTTFQYVKKSKYFVYPLINVNNNMIHYDTFGYVVLEALLLGTVVIAPKIGVYEELYGDAICYIDTQDIIPEEDLLNWKRANANFGYPTVQRYVDKIKWLDKNDDVRNTYIQRGLALRYKFSNVNITHTFLKYLSDH